jgi:hypothetical protein
MDSRKLVLKLPKGKLPFIGVNLGTRYNRFDPDPCRFNADLVNDHGAEIYQIHLELFTDHLNLRLICENLVLIRDYKELKYDTVKLKTWVYMAQNAKQYHFGHVIEKNGKDEIAMTLTKRLFCLKVEAIRYVVGNMVMDRIPY